MTTTVSADEIAKLKGEHRDTELHSLDTDDGDIVVRVPTPAEYQAFVDEREKADAKAAALHNFAVACVVWPDAPTFASLIRRRPALTTSIGNELLQLAGIQAVKKRKKL